MSMVRKVTYSLPEEVVAGIQEAVQAGAAPSQSSVVREAVTHYLAHVRQQQLADEYADASRDEDFMRDSDRVLSEFEPFDDDVEETAE